MGVQLTGLIKPDPIEFKDMAGHIIAIDALNSLYQFLSSIRQPTGEPLKDSSGRITSHLSGLFYRNVNIIDQGIKPIYVFDGKPPELKKATVAMRREVREEAEARWNTALAEGRMEEARAAAQQASRFTKDMLEDSKRLLDLMGIPYIQAPSEGEAQAAYMVSRGDAWAVGSQDYDSLLFGATRLVRNITVSGRRKLPRKQVYVDVVPEIFYLDKVLAALDVTREQLVDVAILMGTDFNPKGVEGIGPKKAYKLVVEYGTASEAVREKGLEIDFDIEAVKEIFMDIPVVEDYDIQWKVPDRDGIMGFMCDEREFSSGRMEKPLKKLEKSMSDAKSQANLDSWFG
jgi:flap endonuclease-1